MQALITLTQLKLIVYSSIQINNQQKYKKKDKKKKEEGKKKRRRVTSE